MYPKYLHLINQYPTEEEFREAWKVVYDFYPEECEFTFDNPGSVRTPTKREPESIFNRLFKRLHVSAFPPETRMCINGSFGGYIETPVVTNPDSLYYTGCGCTWDTDDNGDRFRLLDRKTGRPYSWEDAVAIETIKNYIKNNKLMVRDRKLKELGL